MKVIMLKTINGNRFSFAEGEKYKALDGDEVGLSELTGKLLVRQPNSPKGKNWWCLFPKTEMGRIFKH